VAVRLDRALRNIVYHLEAATPTSTRVRNRFEYYCPAHRECPFDAGGFRKFWVELLGSGADEGATDMDNREAECAAYVHVEYPTDPLDLLELQCLIASDRHDLRKILRDEAKWRLGYKDQGGTYASTATGVFNRWIDGDEINKAEPALWRFSLRLGFWVREPE
jgi:hypothetical protein